MHSARTPHSQFLAHNSKYRMSGDPATEPKLDEFVGDDKADEDDDGDLDSLGE